MAGSDNLMSSELSFEKESKLIYKRLIKNHDAICITVS